MTEEEVGTLRKVCCQRNIVFDWEVENFSSLSDEIGEVFFSPDFRFWGRRWHLTLTPNDEIDENSEGYIGLFLCSRQPCRPLKVDFTLGIRTAEGEAIIWETSTATFEDRRCFSGPAKAILRSELFRRKQELLPLDVLTLTATLNVRKGVPPEDGAENVSKDDVAAAEKCEPQEETGSEKVLQDIGKLWPSGDHSDVVLKVQNVEFKAHRAILAVRTPVLGAMFSHDTSEKISGVVTVEDCEPAVVEQFLHYIYTGAPRELTARNAASLYVLADKYLVSEIKKLCVKCMQDTLCLDTFCKTVTLSLMYNEDKLLETAVDFFSKNKLRILESVEWQVFMRDHWTWANEILISDVKIEARNGKRERAGADSSEA